MLFHDLWCANCIKFRHCKIVNKTMLLDVDDPNYPEQWQYNEVGNEVCTAFSDTVPTPGATERSRHKRLEKRGQLRMF